jgi:hypothetical protein
MSYGAADSPASRGTMTIAKRIAGHKVRIGGTRHSGWLPANATTPLPTPLREVLLDIEIQFDESGYVLWYMSQDGVLHGDTWHEMLAEAEQEASQVFGVQADQWQNLP